MIVVQDVPEVAAYVERSLGMKLSEPRIVLGFIRDDGRPMAAAVLNDYTGSNIEVTIVAEPRGVTLELLSYLGRYIFKQLGCRRLTVRTKKRNRHARRILHNPRHRFQFECVARDYFPDDDAVVFRLLKNDCPWGIR